MISPSTLNVKLDNNLFAQLLSQASVSPRKRSHYNLHADLNEPVQRLCIALKKGTYVQPHHHPKSNKWELMLVLRGSVDLVIFNNTGTVLEKLLLSPGDELSGIELKPNTWHTVLPHSDDAIIMEVKEGPFTPTDKSDFASWAPAEGDDRVISFLSWLEDAKPGDCYNE